jgi:5-bromo-4-chloroindolyl phosphate hydrolysis protein
MNELSLTDIFFIITGSAVVIITIMLAIGLLYVISFIRTIRRVGKTAQRATEIVSEDISDLRDNIRENGVNLGAFAKFANNIRKGKSKSKK